MADYADDFEEEPEEDNLGPVLPREDRLWRHPSELTAEDFRSLDPVDVRSRWLQTQPTRASAWTAGLVGALLATGLVVLGTHLGGALTGGVAPPVPTLSSVSISSGPSTSTPTSMLTLGKVVSRSVKRTTGAIGAITLNSDGRNLRELALAVNASGFFVVPSAELADASSILVTLSDGVEYVGEVVGADPALGIALLHINGSERLSTAQFAGSGDPNLAVAIVTAGGKTAVTSLSPMTRHPRMNGHLLSNAMVADLPPQNATTGSVLIDGSGRVAGMIIGTSRGRVIAISGNDLASAVHGLISEQIFSAMELGLTDETTIGSVLPPGARIVSIARGSAGALAGLSPGDVVVGVNGVTVVSKSNFDAALREASPTAPLVLTVVSRSSSRTVIVPPPLSANP